MTVAERLHRHGEHDARVSGIAFAIGAARGRASPSLPRAAAAVLELDGSTAFQ